MRHPAKILGSLYLVLISACALAAPPSIDNTTQATLIFTATGLGKDYRGMNLGTGSLRLYEPGRQCEYPPVSLTETQDVNADQPVVLMTIPAERPLVVSSVWSSGAAHCIVGNYTFTAKEDVVYRLTNTQDRSKGVCSLRLQRLVRASNRYENDYSLRRLRAGCTPQRAALD